MSSCWFVTATRQKRREGTKMELLITIDALKRSSANSITAVIPYFGYARQDRRAAGRQPISAKLVADLIQKAGAEKVISVDFHSSPIEGFFDIPVDNVKGSLFLAKQIKKLDIPQLTIVSPDHGGAVRARAVANNIGAPLAVIDKRRESANKAEAMFILGNVQDRNILLVDDMVDTAGTIATSIKMLKENGAKDIYVAASHAVLSTDGEPKKALNRMIDAGAKKFFTTNTIEKSFEDPNMEVFEIGTLVGKMLQTITNLDSLSELFEKE